MVKNLIRGISIKAYFLVIFGGLLIYLRCRRSILACNRSGLVCFFSILFLSTRVRQVWSIL